MTKAPPQKSKTAKSNNSNAWTGNKNYKPPKIPPKDLNKPKPTGQGKVPPTPAGKKPPPKKSSDNWWANKENMKKARCSPSKPC